MSSISGSTTSSLESYATQLAQSSSLKRSLVGIGKAIESGDLTSAGKLITSFVHQNPQYSSSAPAGTSQDPIANDFQTLASAVSNKQLGAAQTAWSKVKTDLTKDGVHLSSSNESTAALLKQNKASIDHQFIQDLFGSSSSDSSSLSSLLGGSSSSSSSIGLSSSVLSDWVTYQEGGNTSRSNPAGKILNTKA